MKQLNNGMARALPGSRQLARFTLNRSSRPRGGRERLTTCHCNSMICLRQISVATGGDRYKLTETASDQIVPAVFVIVTLLPAWTVVADVVADQFVCEPHCFQRAGPELARFFEHKDMFAAQAADQAAR